MVKVIEKPLDRLDPMFRESPTRYPVHALSKRYTSDVKPAGNDRSEAKTQAANEPPPQADGGVGFG
jgi:hypothetical protein